MSSRVRRPLLCFCRLRGLAVLGMVVVGAAVLGKDNNPLYIRAFGSHDQLRFHFIVHTALDFVEEKGNAAPTASRHFFSRARPSPRQPREYSRVRLRPLRAFVHRSRGAAAAGDAAARGRLWRLET